MKRATLRVIRRQTTRAVELDPSLSRDWHPTKNGDLTPSDVRPHSHRKVWWICEKGHEWQATVSNRVDRRSGCPKCSRHLASEENNLQICYPDIAMEWHPTKNGTLRPSDVTPHTGRKVWWICEKGHEWQAAVWTRVDKDCGCPMCSGRVATNDNNLAVVRPDLAKEWHPTKNGDLRPTDVKPKSNRKVWWLCKMDHEWEAVVKNRTYGSGCPYCRWQSHRQ